MFRNILVSIDDSTHAQKALSEAIDLASATRARLTILSAVPGPRAVAYSPAGAAAIDELTADAENETQRILRAAVSVVPQSIPVTCVLSHEPIRKALMHQIETGNHDLLVMGSRGRGALKAQLLGSVSHFALEHSPIPVLVVHADASTAADDPLDALAATA